MNLKVLLPSQVLVDEEDVLRLVVETSQGSWGMLPHRLDCVAALVPGILSFETRLQGLTYLAVDVGVLVKTGGEVRISVRRAVAGGDLVRLQGTVEHEFAVLDQTERDVRRASAKIENGFLRRMAALNHD